MTASVPYFILDSPLGQVPRPEFQPGLTFGLVGLGLVLLAGALLRLSSRSTSPIPIAGRLGLGAAAARRREPGAHEDDLGTSPRNGDLRKDEAMEPAGRTGSMR